MNRWTKEEDVKILSDSSVEILRNFNTLYLAHLKDKELIKNYGNTEKFAKILADKWVLVDSAERRVFGVLNPHIKEELRDAGVDGWRIDNLGMCCRQDTKGYLDEGNYEGFALQVNLKTGEVMRKLPDDVVLCKECGRFQQKNNFKAGMCSTCWSRNYASRQGYHWHTPSSTYTIIEKIDLRKEPTLGAEIERDFISEEGYLTTEKANAAVEEVCEILYKDELKTNTKPKFYKSAFERDGSLDGDGVEWITPPRTYSYYKEHQKTLEKVFQIFKNHDLGASRNTGNHIHLGRAFFGNESKYAAAKMAIILNRFWMEWTAIADRRTDSQRYWQKPTQTATDDLFTLVEKTINGQFEHGNAVNLQHTQTIELRLWGWCDSVDDLLLFLDLTRALAFFTKKKGLKTVQTCKLSDVFKILKDKRKHVAEIKKRLNNRNIHDHDADLDEIIRKLDDRKEKKAQKGGD